jgi:hypothetical protein
MAEKNLFSYPLDLDVEKRPVYGFIDDRGPRAASGYGSAVFVFKDSVRKRTTFTLLDSLGPGTYPDGYTGGYPSPLYRASLGSKNMLSPNSDILNYTDFKSFWSGFAEAQIHDGVTMDDVAEILFEEENPGSYLSKEQLDALKERGIEVRRVARAGWEY